MKQDLTVVSEVGVESMSKKKNFKKHIRLRKEEFKNGQKKLDRFANVWKSCFSSVCQCDWFMGYWLASVDAKNRYILRKTNKTSKINDESLHVYSNFFGKCIGQFIIYD